MNHRPAFTILELLISITLSSMIMLGLVQLYQGVARYLEATRDMMSVNRKVCLLFNQLERDFSSSYIPVLAKEEKVAKEGQPPTGPADEKKPAAAVEEKTPEQKKKDEELDKERLKSFFIGMIDERAEATKINNKKIEAGKLISFICSSPLQVYGEKRPRLVRVVYEIVIDKAKSTRDVVSYQLLRKETDDLFNTRCKIDEFARPEPGKAIRSYVVADDVKGFFVEYVTKKEEKGDKPKEKPTEPQEIRSFSWGNKEELQGVVPEKVLIWIDFWNDKKTKGTQFHALFPILSYPTPKKDTKKDDEKDKKQKDDQQPAAGQSVGGDTPPTQGATPPSETLPAATQGGGA